LPSRMPGKRKIYMSSTGPGLPQKGPSEKERLRQERERGLRQNVTLLLLASLLLIFVVNLIVPSRSYSEAENRKLAGRPEVTAESIKSGKFFSDYSSYFADQFFLRDRWINLTYNVRYLTGSREFKDGYIGKNGYLFSKPAQPSKDLDATVSAISDFTARHPGLTQTMIVAPDAASVLTGKLPDGADVRDQTKDIADFEGNVSAAAPSIQMVDASSILKANADSYIYYKTDHHWTTLGAFLVFQGSAQPLGIPTPVTPDQADQAQDGSITYAPYTVSIDFRGTLSSRSGNSTSKDSIDIYRPQKADSQYVVSIPSAAQAGSQADGDRYGSKKTSTLYDTAALSSRDQYTLFLGGNYPLVEITTTNDTGRNLMIFKDSYANSFVPFLTPYFDKIILIDPRYYYDDVDRAIDRFGITDVLYLYSGDTILTDPSLGDTLAAKKEADQ
jgi:hypothetical protein